MNNKKKMVLGAAFIVAIMALAGIGYAAAQTAYTGSTESGSADVNVDYVTVVLNEEAYTDTYNARMTYNTETAYDSGIVTKYKCTGADYIEHAVTVTIPNDETTDTFEITVTADADELSDLQDLGYKLFYVVSDTAPSATDGSVGQEYTGAGSLGITLSASTMITGQTVHIFWFAVDGTGSGANSIYNIFVERDPVPPVSVVLPSVTYLVTGTNHNA